MIPTPQPVPHGVRLFDVGHRTFRRGVELFDVASNFSTWRRIIRRGGVDMFDVGHRNVAGECPRAAPTFTHIPTSPHTSEKPFVLRYSPPRPLPQNPVWAGFTFSLGTSNLRPCPPIRHPCISFVETKARKLTFTPTLTSKTWETYGAYCTPRR